MVGTTVPIMEPFRVASFPIQPSHGKAYALHIVDFRVPPPCTPGHSEDTDYVTSWRHRLRKWRLHRCFHSNVVDGRSQARTKLMWPASVAHFVTRSWRGVFTPMWLMV